MGNRINRNIEWVVDDFGNVVGYQVNQGDIRPIGGGGGAAAVQSLGNKAGAFNVDLTAGANVLLTCTAAIQLGLSGLPTDGKGMRLVLTITNGAAGVTWPAGIRWAGAGIVGSAPALSAGTEKVVLDVYTLSGVTTIDGSYVGRVA
ncbi:hypothetical protein [Roseateles chitosanitabidus]|uniref:hypothetical protein n=1 Tax=Roseateles chitosanitabidus TaxID=65048 RepID=UPI0008299FB1|nr:hypothetical protein [Roseateles chitosanitabidus]